MKKSIRPWVLLTGILAVVGLGVTPEVHAECAGNRCAGEIQQVLVQSTIGSDGRVLVGTDGDESDLNCTPVQGRYVVLSPSQPLFREMYALLLEGLDDDHRAIVRLAPESTPCRILSVLLNAADDDDDLLDNLGE